MDPGDLVGAPGFYLTALVIGATLLAIAGARSYFQGPLAGARWGRTSARLVGVPLGGTVLGVALVAAWFALPAEPPGYLNVLFSDAYFFLALGLFGGAVARLGSGSGRPGEPTLLRRTAG